MEGKPLVREALLQSLRERIAALQSDGFVRIPSERGLSETLGASRISVRSAIKVLVNEGLLTQEQGRGTYITPRALLRELHIAVSPDIKPNDPFYAEFLVQMTGLAARRSISLFIVQPHRIPQSRQQAPLVVVGQLEEGIMRELSAAYPRYVTLLSEAGDTAGADCIVFDDERIGASAADQLFERGHRRLLHLAGPGKYRSARLRRLGFETRVQQRGGSLTVLAAKMNWQGGYALGELAAALLAAPDAPTAVFAANDWMAAGLIQALKERGFRLPEALSVIGCDDIALAKEFEPSIATFRLDMSAMIGSAIALLEGSRGRAAPEETPIRLPADFIARASVAFAKPE